MRPRRVSLGVEVMLGFGVGGACFAVVAVVVAVAESDVLVAVVGVACVAAVVAIARRWGVAYAAPAAIASLLAFDWFRFPPTHARAFPGPGDLASLLGYIAVAVLIGELAAYAGRRADVSELARSELAGEQAALRRVATLVARGASPDEVFAAVAAEVGELLGVDGARVVRYAGDEEVVQLAGWSAPGYDAPALGRAKLEPTSLAGAVLRSGRAARIDDYAAIDRVLSRPVQRAGARSGVGAPIVVDGRLWGAIAAWLMRPEPLPDTAEARLADFTELIATAISNTASREQLARLADEQAALRRVATLVARESPPAEVFAAVAEEVGQLLGTNATALCRYELDATVTVLALETDVDLGVRVGARITLEGENAMGAVFRTGRAARQDSFERTPARSPILPAKGAWALRSAPRSWSKGASGEWWSCLRAAAHSRPTLSSAWATSASLSPPRSRTPRRARRSDGSRISRRPCAGSQRSSHRRRRRPRC